MVRSPGVAVFLQARLGSTRLPSKALFMLSHKSALGWAMTRLRKIPASRHVLLTDSMSIQTLGQEAEKYGFEIMEGPAEDVLRRFAIAAEKYSPDIIIRATGDNPLVFYLQAQEILKDHIERNADHSWFTGMPLGAGVEIVDADKLLEADMLAQDPYEREHVTPYIYRRPEKFRLNHRKAGIDAFYPEGRITMDTMNDYLYLKKIFEQSPSGFIEDTSSLISWLAENPHPDSIK